MELQWLFVFLVLLAEIVLCLLFILPLPLSLKKILLSICSIAQNPKVKTALTAVFLIVAFLFVDSLRSSSHLKEELHQHRDATQVVSNVHNRLFRAQRNSYLTGFTLFLMLVLYRFQDNTVQLIDAEEREKKSRAEIGRLSTEKTRLEGLASGSTGTAELERQNATLKEENETLLKEISKLSGKKGVGEKKSD